MNENDTTNGRRKALIEKLTAQVRDAIDASYYTGEPNRANGSKPTRDTDDARAIRDYVRNMSWSDKFDDLIDREAAHERRHRKGAPAGFRYPISVKQSASIIVLHQFGNGSALEAMPPATLYNSCRDTAAEAIVLGYLARAQVTPELRAQLDALDYAAAVRS